MDPRDLDVFYLWKLNKMKASVIHTYFCVELCSKHSWFILCCVIKSKQDKLLMNTKHAFNMALIIFPSSYCIIKGIISFCSAYPRLSFFFPSLLFHPSRTIVIYLIIRTMQNLLLLLWNTNMTYLDFSVFCLLTGERDQAIMVMDLRTLI